MTDIEQRLAAAGLRVKPLEIRGGIVAPSGYDFELHDGGITVSHLGKLIGSFYGLDDAKAALQAHNVAAILSSLEVIE